MMRLLMGKDFLLRKQFAEITEKDGGKKNMNLKSGHNKSYLSLLSDF